MWLQGWGLRNSHSHIIIYSLIVDLGMGDYVIFGVLSEANVGLSERWPSEAVLLRVEGALWYDTKKFNDIKSEKMILIYPRCTV